MTTSDEHVHATALTVGEQLIQGVARRLDVYPTDYVREIVVATLDELLPDDAQLDGSDALPNAFGWAAVADALRRRARREPLPGQHRERVGWDALTPTEARVARMIASGRSNRQIADELRSSVRTVETHVSHVLSKLGVRTRVDVAREVTRRAGT